MEFSRSTLWFALEALAALGLLLFVVWWTWPKKRLEDTDADREKSDDVPPQ